MRITTIQVFETKMAPGRCTRQRTMTIAVSTVAPPTSDTPSQSSLEDVENVASSTFRKGRGKTRGVAVAKAIEGTGGRIKITFPPGKRTPVGGWAKSWKSELGVICRTLAPITCKGWKKMIKEDKQVIYDRIVEKFDVDFSLWNVRLGTEKYLGMRFKSYRHRVHNYYKQINNHNLARQRPYDGIAQEDWEEVCKQFNDEAFKKRCKKNAENRSKLKLIHRNGSKSFTQLRHDIETETKKEINRIDFYKRCYWTLENGWSSEQAEKNYDRMVEMQSQTTPEGSNPLTPDQICEEVLGVKSGYVRGLGYGEIPIPSSSSARYTRSEVEEAKKRAEDAERQAHELAQQVQTQKMEMEAQRQEINQMRDAQSEIQNQMQSQMQSQMQAMFESFAARYGGVTSS